MGGFMPSIDAEIQSGRAAVEELIGATSRCGETWDHPRAPGKWSPAQVVEHVARSLEASATDMAGEASGLPALPAPLRFLARTLLFKRVVRSGRFPRARTNRAMNPERGPATPAEGVERLQAAWKTYDEATQRRASVQESAASRTFGTVPLQDYLRFQELHVRHHRKQIPEA